MISCFILCIAIVAIVIDWSNNKKRNVIANDESTYTEDNSNIASENTETTNSATQDNTEYETSLEFVLEGIDVKSEDVCVCGELITDSIDYYIYDSEKNTIEFDTKRGYRYVIDINTERIISDNKATTKLVDCTINDNIIVIKLINDVFPNGFIYIINVNEEKTFNTDFMTYADLSNLYYVYEDGRIEFYTSGESYFCLNYITKDVLVTPFFEMVIQDVIIEENTLCLKVLHRGYEKSCIYMFDLSKNRRTNNTPINGFINKKDDVLYLKVNMEHRYIDFDSMKEPQYTIDYNTGEIIDSSCALFMGEDAITEVRYFEKRDNIIIITLYSDELPEEITYVFDISSYVS